MLANCVAARRTSMCKRYLLFTNKITLRSFFVSSTECANNSDREWRDTNRIRYRMEANGKRELKMFICISPIDIQCSRDSGFSIQNRCNCKLWIGESLRLSYSRPVKLQKSFLFTEIVMSSRVRITCAGLWRQPSAVYLHFTYSCGALPPPSCTVHWFQDDS